MRRREGKARDFTVTARRVVEQAIGEHLNGTPLERAKPESAKAKSGRLGGLKGGIARAKMLTKKQRHAIGKKAAQARWAKRNKK